MTAVSAPESSTPVPTPTPSRTRAWWTWGFLFGFLCFLMLVVGLESALHFLGPAIDGPFQLYNSLRRIAVGQRGGVDFQFFHGLGIPYLHYLPYRLFGARFIPSEITRQLVSIVAYPLTVVIVLRFFLRDWLRTIAWSGIVMAGSIALRMTSVLVAINSLLGIRSSLPTILPVFLALGAPRRWRVVLSGLVLGGALVMGTEQGLAAALALVIATAVMAIRSRTRREWVVDGAAILAIGIGTLMVLLMLAGGVTGMHRALVYNFKLVPADQYWYFGSPPNRFLSSWREMPALLATIPRIPISILVGAAVVVVTLRRLWLGADAVDARERFAFAVLATYGLISCASLLGTYANAYIQPLLRVLLLLGAIWLDRALPAYDAQKGRPLTLGVGRSVIATAVAALLIMVAVVPSTYTLIFVTMPHTIRDHFIRGEGAVYSGIWPETIIGGQAILDSQRGPDGKLPTLWSTYAGLLEARNGLFQPSTDYIIHALGPDNRAKYVTDFERVRPELVQTVSPSYTQYESWIEATSWDFYVDVLRNYELIGSTPWSLFWKRQTVAQPAPQVVWSAPVPHGVSSITLPVIPQPPGGSQVVLLQVEIDYKIHNPLGKLPLVGAMPRYLVKATRALQKDPVTIDPYTTTARFPLIGIVGQAPILQWGAYSLLPGASLEVSAVRLSVVNTSPRNGPWFQALVSSQTQVMTQ